MVLSIININAGEGAVADIVIRIPEKAIRIAAALVGAVVLILFAGQLWSSGAFRPHYQVQMFVPKADGLQAGNEVLLSGMRVGSVGKVEFEDHPSDPERSIRVTLRIERRYQDWIRSDASASLARFGLLSDRYVEIHRSRTGDPIADGGEIRLRPTYEPTPMEFIDLLRNRSNCNDGAKNQPEVKPDTTK